MTWKRNILVVANVTAASDELLEDLKRRAREDQVSFTLIVPATPFGGGHDAAEAKVNEAVKQLRAAGLEITGSIGAPDPVVAVNNVWNPTEFDEIIVCTLPMKFSKWLHAGLPERISKLTDAKVTHLVARPPKPEVQPGPPPQHEQPALGPLSVLGWGGPHKEE